MESPNQAERELNVSERFIEEFKKRMSILATSLSHQDENLIRLRQDCMRLVDKYDSGPAERISDKLQGKKEAEERIHEPLSERLFRLFEYVDDLETVIASHNNRLGEDIRNLESFI